MGILYAQVPAWPERGEKNYVMVPTEEAERLDLSFPTTICAQVRVSLTDSNWEKLDHAGYSILMGGVD